MDKQLAKKLEGPEGENLRQDIIKLAKNYIDLGRRSAEYYTPDFDVAHDLFQCYAQLSKHDLENLEGGHPKRYVLPMTSTQITTMATYIAQAIFGTATPHKVEGRGPEDETPAAIMNQLLRWNDERQPMYSIGYMWVVDCLLYNRGIMYEAYEPVYATKMEPKEVVDPYAPEPEEGEAPKTYTKWVRKQEKIGSYNKFYIISPYDLLSDPGLPLYRKDEMRFLGHGSRVPWVELKRRAALPVEDPMFVFASAVNVLKTSKNNGGTSTTLQPSTSGASTPLLESRTAFDRSKPSTPLGQDTANKEDGGYIDLVELWVKLIPSDYGLSDAEAVSTWRILLGNDSELLAIDEMIYAHDTYPYSIGEARPSPHYQYTPSWALELKPIQDYVDYLKNRRQEAISNTVGNMFLIKPDKVSVADFEDPNKEGKFISILPEAGDVDLNTVVKQVPIVDLTQNFSADLTRFMGFAELFTGANSTIQGVAGDESATAEAGAQQMAMGRLTSVARMLSVQAIVPQTRRIVSNYQQFLDEEFLVKIKGDLFDMPPEFWDQKTVKITRDAIQGEFDFIPSDGTLPATDAKKVAALTRIIESAGAFPFLFDPNKPGSLDLKRIYAATVKAAGVNLENFTIKAPPAPPEPTSAGLPPPAPVPTSSPMTSSEPRAEELGGGLKAPAIQLPNIEPQARPANV